MSIEHLLDFSDKEGHFKNIKTLRTYFNIFLNQIEPILVFINSQIIKLKGDYEMTGLLPGDDRISKKLVILFQMIDELVELLQKKGISPIVLEDEKYCCFHWYLFDKSKIFLLKKCNSP